MIKMPWGKFQGRMIYNVPNDYLEWFLNHSHGGVEQRDEWVFDAVRKELEDREKSGYYIPAE